VLTSKATTELRQVPTKLRPWLAQHWAEASRAMLREVEQAARVLHEGGTRPSVILAAARKGCAPR
jgi:hypothetical protein